MTHYNQEDLLKAIRSIHWLRVINSASDQVDMFRLTVIKSSQYLGLINDATWCVQIENDQSKTRDQRWATIGKTTFKSRVIKSRWKLKRNQSCVSIWETISGWERIKSIYYTRIINDTPPPQTGWGPTNQIYYFWMTTDAFRNGRQFLVEGDQNKIRLENN